MTRAKNVEILGKIVITTITITPSKVERDGQRMTTPVEISNVSTATKLTSHIPHFTLI